MSDLWKDTKLKCIHLLRHGETEWTKSGQHTGLTDIDLTREGRKEAKKLGKSLKKIHFDHVFCSPLRRVRETCRLAGLSEGVVYDSDLLEWDYGEYEGITSKEIHKTNPDWTIFTQDPPGGETAEAVGKRADSMIEKALKLEGVVAFVSSGHFTRVLGARWLDFPVSYGQYLILSTGSKSLLSFEHGHPAIQVWNDTSHIK